MKKHFTRLLVTALAAFLLLNSVGSALACTGVYVGKDVSADGSIIIARCEDISAVYDKLQTYVPASDEAGRTMDDINGFSYPLPTHTYAYTQMEDHPNAGDGLYAAVCVNEKGVAITGTVTAYGCGAWREADPFVEEGLREAVIPCLAAATADTAKQAVDVLTKAVDTYGSESGHIIMMADQNEAWILEIYGGKNYVAMKLPDDQVAVFGNQFMIGAIDPEDTENFVVSKDFVATLEKAELVKKDDDGKVLAAQSVCNGERGDGSNLRNWGGMHLLAPALAGDEYNTDTFYPLLYKPDAEKVTLQDVFEVYRCRYEGTPYDLSLEGQESNRAIAVSGTPDTHVIQLFADMPAAYSAVTWLALAGGEHSVFFPEISGVTQLPESLGVVAESYDPDSAYWTFKRICGLADVNRALYSKGVQNFWKLQEEVYIAQLDEQLAQLKALAESDPDGAVEYVNKHLADNLDDLTKKSEVLFGELLTLVNRNAGYAASRAKAFEPSIPLRVAAEAKGYTVTWNAATKAVTLTKGSTTKTVSTTNGDAVVIDGVTYVPYSFLEEL